MIKSNTLTLTCLVLMFFARGIATLVFYLSGYIQTAIYCFIVTIFYLISSCFLYTGRRLYIRWTKNHDFAKFYRIITKKYGKNSLNYKITKAILKTNLLNIRHFTLYGFQLEIIISLIYTSFTIGWGWGFDIYLLVICNYFYLNLKKRRKIIYIFPLIYLLIHILTYVCSKKMYGEDTVIIIYLINSIFSMVILFSILIIIELGQVIKFINDENRKMHIKRLISYDQLTDTYQKYSFLEIMNEKLEHNTQEDIITQASVILIEITNLKRINEYYSTRLGNEVLKEFAYILKKHSENYDNYISRWSGDEFLIFIMNEDIVVVKNYIEEIKEEAQKNRFGLKGAKIQIVFGLAHTNEFDYDMNKFIQQAQDDFIKQRDKLNILKGDI